MALALGTAVAAQGAVGSAPPSNAIVLFDGGDLDGWLDAQDRPAAWRVHGEDLIVEPGRGDIFTRRSFSDFQLHLEFWLPEMPEATGQDRANSGIYLQGRYELQILDSFGMEPTDDSCGALYQRAAPLWNACRRPEVWQVLDVAFCCPRQEDGARRCPRLTAFLNGLLIHNSLPVSGPTGGALDDDQSAPGPLRLQDHGCPVRFRNIWIVPAGSP
jgi:hypothetical protein